MEHEGDGDTDYNWCARNNLPKLDKRNGRLIIKRASGDHPLLESASKTWKGDKRNWKSSEESRPNLPQHY